MDPQNISSQSQQPIIPKPRRSFLPYIVIGGLCFLIPIIIFLYSIIRKNTTTSPETVWVNNQPQSITSKVMSKPHVWKCSHTQEAINVLTDNSKDIGLTIYNNGSSGFLWRENQANPFVSFAFDDSADFYRYGSAEAQKIMNKKPSKEEMVESLKNMLSSPTPAFPVEDVQMNVNNLEDAGFILDRVNSIPQYDLNGNSHYAFVKDSELYNITMTPTALEDTYYFSLHCLLQSQSVRKNMKSVFQLIDPIIPYSKWDSKTILGTPKLYDTLVVFDISELGGGGGAIEEWLKVDNHWELIYSGNGQPPNCDMYEKRKIGKGIECTRCSGSSSDQTQVSCLYSIVTY